MVLLNIILPVFMFFMFNIVLVLIAVVGNFVIDSAIYLLYLKKNDLTVRNTSTLGNHWGFIWKAYALGFAADFVGVIILWGAYSIGGFKTGINYWTIFDPWYNALFHILIIGLVGVLIYYGNRWILKKSNLDVIHQYRIALWMAVLTAPYTFLLSTSWFY